MMSKHYEQKLDGELIIQRLQEAYPEGPSHFQIAPIDQLHIGGIKASEKLIARIVQSGAQRVLDVGSGLGGLMRLLESRRNLSVIGLDITHDLNRINQQLSALTPDKSKPEIVTADAHHLPFAGNQFDLIIFQHSLLNMPDDNQVLSECARVLKPQGKLLLHEVVQGANYSAMQYPVPWARSMEDSHLRDTQTICSLLEHKGFTITELSDWSEDALNWRKRQSEKERGQKPQAAPVSPRMVLGPEFQNMGSNVMTNLANNAACVIELVAEKQ
ncbi:MAG: SAM-dependent methyltransferase [Neptuniibacter caesariensis]|uniref:SAM-dependent methyltransferase n=1 Tax=Neptuniibacter caesariensis TaxID=207954 RepID=A0A2G6JB62_NEPCE|nr:MAG: SAM-dependent methyltransferase [Neptuniibacter caesariensis]